MLSFSVCINYITVNSGMDYKYFVEIKSTDKIKYYCENDGSFTDIKSQK